LSPTSPRRKSLPGPGIRRHTAIDTQPPVVVDTARGHVTSRRADEIADLEERDRLKARRYDIGLGGRPAHTDDGRFFLIGRVGHDETSRALTHFQHTGTDTGLAVRRRLLIADDGHGQTRPEILRRRRDERGLCVAHLG
jgi:hypothetical protein